MKGCSHRSEKPVMHAIHDIVREARDTSTFWFRGEIDAKPGQFVMLWVPGAGLKPFGISYKKDGLFGVTIRRVGTLTERLFALKQGDRVGIQGPYGRGFSGEGSSIALVAGGYGAGPLAFLADELLKKGRKVFLIMGAASRDLLMFRERFHGTGVHMMLSTDDGTEGHKGFCTDCLELLLAKERMDRVYCCGPERMMQRVLSICEDEGIDAELSLDRHMKCGFGVCGSCTLDGSGLRVCSDGPVFTASELRGSPEFGKYKRDASGTKVMM